MLGYNDKLNWQQNADGLKVQMPAQQPNNNAVVFKIDGAV